MVWLLGGVLVELLPKCRGVNEGGAFHRLAFTTCATLSSPIDKHTNA